MDEKISAEARILARELSECSHALEAAASASLPCNKVVKWQVGEFIKLGKSRKEAVQSLHKPEPWAGNLESARILWLGSNPSFSAEEKFPDWMGGWSDEATIDFFTRRFVADPEVRGYGAADTGEGCRDRVIEVGGKLSKAAVRTWTRIRNISALILERRVEETLASRDYAMTEIVHCKSKDENGVREAAKHCKDKWFSRILSHFNHRLIVVHGKPAGIVAKEMFSSLPERWGAWNSEEGEPIATGYWPESLQDLEERSASLRWNLDTQSDHTHDIQIAGRTYTMVWIPHVVKSVPSTLTDPRLIAPELIRRWREAAG